MKTIEEKAKAYDEALERAKQVKLTDTKENVAAAEYIFPELRESEDERISNIILEGFKNYSRSFSEWNDVPVERVIAYLEKQEQKPLSPDEKMNHPLYLEGFDVGREVGKVEAEQKPISSCDIVPYIDDKIAALQDMWRKEKVAFDWDDMHEMIEDVARHFYQKEQKPTPDWMPKFLDELRSKKNYFDWDGHRDIEGHILAIINWIAPNYFKEKEQKPSEKQDYSSLTDFERAIHRGFLCAGVENVPVTIIKETAHECMAKNKPAEWSEEDKQWLESIIREYEERLSVDKDHAAVIQVKINLLKSLRPHWKPSEEQTNVLLSTIQDKHNAARFYSLSSLYTDLKKL